MPIEKKYDLAAVLAAAKAFARRITFEYVLIAGRTTATRTPTPW
jgi:adenine C2-methylase RlmN of 23S rRNA A2503 and tRNA A37